VTVVELTELPSGAIEARVDGRKVAVDLAEVPGASWTVLVDGHVIDLATARYGAVRVESERARAAERAKGAASVVHERVVKSPMPGRVVKVLVAKGEDVEAGQGLVVLEAMKMENEVRARAAGRVDEVHVTAGAAVEGNAKLVTFA
jgi:biotin carboxyl carrier protein